MRVRSILSLLAVCAPTLVFSFACSSSSGGSANDQTDSGTPDGATATDAGNDAAPSSGLGFKPSNIDISGMDLSQITDEDVASNCEVRPSPISDCFLKAATATLQQSDGTKVAVFVVKSLKVEPTAHMTVSGLETNIPVVIVSLGDFALFGTIDAHAQDIHGASGGFEGIMGQAGSGAGGGAVGGDSTGGGGASFCGQGGQGGVVMGSAGVPGAKAAAAGNPEIVPLRGGASGGGASGSKGGAGGGGLQLVAGGAFTSAAGSYINAGGGGGDIGTTSGGGGAGGAILIEAQTVKLAGIVVANGGGGGGSGPGAGLADGSNGTPDATPAAGGTGSNPGGVGSGGATIDGTEPPAATVTPGASGGGGGAGRIRINTTSGQADISAATFSPATTTSCVTQGTVAK